MHSFFKQFLILLFSYFLIGIETQLIDPYIAASFYGVNGISGSNVAGLHKNGMGLYGSKFLHA